MKAYLHAVAMALPERVQSNEELCDGVAGWTAEKVSAKTGIQCRRIAAPNETTADLAVAAAERLLAETDVPRGSIDSLIFCTQTPDYFLPATACPIQHRLGLPTTCAAFDLNQGCSGYPYSLMVARSLLLSGSARRILLLNGDTHSKFCDKSDLSTASLFGDGAAASLLSTEADGAMAMIGESCCGTDGSGAPYVYVPAGACRQPVPTTESPRRMTMNGAAVTSFAAGTVKAGIDRLLNAVSRDWGEIDRFLLHQANPGFVRRLAMALHLPAEKVPIDLADVGNTGSATIPMLIRRCWDRGELTAGLKCVLAGFGTGFSWGMTYAEWLRSNPLPTESA